MIPYLSEGDEKRLDKRRWSRAKRNKSAYRIATIIILLVIILIALPLFIASRPAFFAGYRDLKSAYQSWNTSSHKEVTCVECHVPSGFLTGVSYRLKTIAEFYKRAFSRSPVKETALIDFKKPTNESCLTCHGKQRKLPEHPLVRIPHTAHVNLTEEKRTCVKCHKWLVHSEKQQKKHKTLPFTGICTAYGCHSGTVKVQECKDCHHREVITATVWRQKHPQVVSTRGSNACLEYCHQASFCQTCHTTGKKPLISSTKISLVQTGLVVKHTMANWKDVHGKEAIVDTNRCLYCHSSIQVCTNCHKKSYPKSHRPKTTWLAAHKNKAKVNKKRCLFCHEEKVCNNCHQLFREVR
jgi:hypothetical protein